MFHSERPIPVHKMVPLHRTRWVRLPSGPPFQNPNTMKLGALKPPLSRRSNVTDTVQRGESGIESLAPGVRNGNSNPSMSRSSSPFSRSRSLMRSTSFPSLEVVEISRLKPPCRSHHGTCQSLPADFTRPCAWVRMGTVRQPLAQNRPRRMRLHSLSSGAGRFLGIIITTAFSDGAARS
ncbi:hypothetical protein KC338_g234 [Hortaea werneckii]|nr:hypothetical protein KC338_g234 [Hortaea werneckii]